jgi:PleD family two-component response regulator
MINCSGRGQHFVLQAARRAALHRLRVDAHRQPPCDPGGVPSCLIVDDSPRFVDAARGLLEREGIAVVGVASTGAEALQRAEELQPDVTLVDIDLGGQSGFEVVLDREVGLAPSRVILISIHTPRRTTPT